MTKATEPKTLYGAMALAFAEIEGATKAATNPHFGKKYADLGAVLAAIKPPLIKHGLFFTQRTQPSQDGVTVETMLHHSSGEEMNLGTLYVPADKRDAQKFGSALSYARRYSLLTAFGVPTEDDDGNAAAKPTPKPDPEPQVTMIDDIQRDTIMALSKAADVNVLSILDTVNAKLPSEAKVKDLNGLNEAQAASIIKKLNKTIEAKTEKPTETKTDILDDEVKY